MVRKDPALEHGVCREKHLVSGELSGSRTPSERCQPRLFYRLHCVTIPTGERGPAQYRHLRFGGAVPAGAVLGG
jgi:hypothetical protein